MSKKKHYGNNANNERQQAAPQEHLAPAKGPKTFRTSSGFEYRITENMSDFRLVDALVTMQDPSLDEGTRSVACVKALHFLLGDNQKEALFAHVVKIYGWASPGAVAKELMEIIGNFDENKKK